MSLTNSATHYGSITKTFHWVIALGILTMIPLGLIGTEMAHRLTAPGQTPSEAFVARTVFVFSLHKTLGLVIFFTALARILWAFSQPRPGLLNADHRIEAFLAHTIHWLLYSALVLVPLTGWIHNAATSGFAPIWWPFGQGLPFVPKDAGVADFFAGLHHLFAFVLIGAVLLHVAGALKHHVIDRDATLRRMLPGGGDHPTPPAQTHSKAPVAFAAVVWLAAVAYATFSVAPKSAESPVETAAIAEAEDVTGTPWTVNEGTLALTITQLGNPVEGAFDTWTAAIRFDERSDPGPAGSVSVSVAIPSLRLGTVSDQAMGPDFFDAESYPTATFVADITRTETGYIATGPLTIRDQSLPLVLPFDLAVENDIATMTGSIGVDRLDFGIGASVTDEATLAFSVAISVSLTATRETE